MEPCASTGCSGRRPQCAPGRGLRPHGEVSLPGSEQHAGARRHQQSAHVGPFRVACRRGQRCRGRERGSNLQDEDDRAR